jgi:hypothetical protein
MTARATLFTSLPPRLARQIAGAEVGPAYLAECVKSWRRAGFDVVSLNCAQEIDELAPCRYDVYYREVTADRPTLGDFLHAVLASARPVAGIINADIFLANQPILLDAVIDRAAGGMVVAERMNIDPVSQRLTWQTCHGFDAFIFATEPLSRIGQACELSFGEPWWDYWFPLAYLSTGARLMTTSAPLIFHLDHAQKWRRPQWIASGNKVVRYFLKCARHLPGDVVAQFRRYADSTAVSESELRALSYWCFDWLRNMAEVTRISPPSDATASLSTLLALIDNPDVCHLIGELNKAQAAVINSKEFGAKALIENLADQIGGSTTNVERSRLLVVMYEEIQNMSAVVRGRKVRSGEDALRVVTEGTHTLTSRKANLLHLLALNAAWLKNEYRSLRRALVGSVGRR